MAVRTVTVRLRADVNQYTRSLRQASDRTSQLAGAGAKVGAVMLAGFTVAVAAAAKFDKAMSNVRAVTGATSAEMGKLRAAALEAGKSTSFTASQAADAEAELARAGVSVANITGGALKGTLALAASGQMDLADAAVIAAQAMNTFGLQGKDVTHVADVLSAAANKSAADMSGLGMSLRQGGLLAKQTGLDLEDTVGTLAAFADHALIGSDAGTSLKVMLQRLTPQSDEARQMMAKLGFTAYDSQGKFVGLSKLAGNLQSSFKNLTPEARNAAFATIFGADAVRSATILYELGSKGIDKYVKAVDDQGAASRMASIQTDNLVGDFERLRGALEVALIEGGSSANGALRDMVQWVTNLVNAYNSLPVPLQKAVTLLTGVGGAAMIAVAGFLLLLPRIAATRTALTALGITTARTRAALGTLGTIGSVVGIVAALAVGVNQLKAAMRDAPPSTAKMANSLLDFADTGKISGQAAKSFGKDLGDLNEAVQQIAHPGFNDRIRHFKESMALFTDEDALGTGPMKLDDAKDRIKALDSALAQLVQSGAADQAATIFKGLSSSLDGTSVEKFRSLLPSYTDALADADTQSRTTAEGQSALGDVAQTTADELENQKSAAEQLSDSLDRLNGSAISAAQSEIGFQQSMADLNDAVKDNGHSLDVSTDKGRKVKSAFLDAAKAAMDHAEAVAKEKNSQEAGQKVLEKDIELLKKDLRAKGFSKDAVDRLAAAYLKLPPSVATEVDAKTQGALNGLQAVQEKIKNTKGKKVTVDALTADAKTALESLGFKIKNTKGKKVEITLPTAGPKAAAQAIQNYIDGVHGKTVGVGVYTTEYYKKVQAGGGAGVQLPKGGQARGGLVPGYGAGGAVQIAPNGLLSGPGTGTSDSILALFASGAMGRVANTEFVVNAAATKRWLPLLKAINANRLARGGLASGGIPGFTYTPTGQAVLGGPSDAKERYDKEVEDLKKAWDDLNKALKAQKKAADSLRDAEKNLERVRKGHHTAAQMRAAEEKVDKARSAKKAADKTVSKERSDVYAADKALGVSKGAKAPTVFNLKAYEAQLNKSVASTEKWRKNLNKIGTRGGKELQALLEGMGEDGYALVNALAGASDKQFKSITAKLEKTGELAKATLKDFTNQLNASTKENAQFAADLQKLAAQGFGDLAQALAAQGDSSAMEIAHQAAGDTSAAKKANASVGKAQAALSGDDLSNSLVLLSTLRSGPGKGFADLISAGLDVATIRALVPKMTAQIKALPALYKDTFVQQWNAQGGVAMAAGGILSRPTMVLGAEAGVPESWIPWNGSSRSRALLAKTASSMGYQLVPAGRYGAAPSTATVAREVSKHIEVHLHGAKQTAAEQAHDIARVIGFVG
ncbi:phage tail tape measure protein [Streptomyces sp. NPDC007901]|uniref:phage tail tape measure protein n=1 Tax=Streptomyces sp. NPDC007901 TaxID=3364785 RepID=UPI0036E1CE18